VAFSGSGCGLMVAAAGPLLNQRKRSFNAQRSAHLTWRIFFERGKKLYNNGHAEHLAHSLSPHHLAYIIDSSW
jgi:hypothetical protein